MLWEYLIFGGVAFLMTGVRCEVTEVFVEAGSQAVLPCESSPPSASAAAILWTKANVGTVWRKEKSGLQYWGYGWAKQGTSRIQCPYDEFGRGDYSLHISDVREEDGGDYTCRVDDGKQRVRKVVTLRVITVSVSPSVAVPGGDVSISCDVTPWPMGATLRWRLNGNPFVPQNEIKEVSIPDRGVTKSVMEGKVTERLTGDWTCVVNDQKKESLATKHLSVKGIINPSSDNTKVYAAVGSAVTLPCVFSPGLTPYNPVWERLSAGSLSPSTARSLPPSFRLSSRRLLDSSVSVGEVGSEDGGRYRCSGTVKGYRLSTSLQLVVAKIESNVHSVKKAPATLTCHLSDPSEVTEYEWVHVTYDLNGTESTRSVQKGNVLRIDKVAGDSSGEWVCRFYGEKGILGNVTYHVPLMSGLTGAKEAGLSDNTAMVIGLSFLLLVLLLVVAQMYKNHQRRKRIFQFPALETIVHTISNEREERERNRVKNEDSV
ncbi:lymphocyte activation gene 3 protein-like [Centroberyx affinis]|uniref:lymphocyte activation gene 3 protein-like n=1 Tax=Centroberyx affinis TaxID=166261 RepID=UPI003A5C0F25